MLSERDAQVVQVVLDGLSNILAASGENLEQVTTAIEVCGGLDQIEALQEHHNIDIYRLAYGIIERYFGEGVSQNYVIFSLGVLPASIPIECDHLVFVRLNC